MTFQTITTFSDGDYPVELQTNASGRRYRVIYGVQIKTFDNWLPASHEFAHCVFHSLECASKIERGE